MNKRLMPVALATVALCLASCSDKHNDFGTFIPLPQEGWAYGDTLTVLAEGLDSLPPQGSRKLKVGVRHANDYDYRNVILEITYPDGKRVRRDTVNMELADVYGAWLGTGMGPVYQAEATVTTNAHVPDSALVKVRHVMRVDTLRGIEQIGIIIDKP